MRNLICPDDEKPSPDNQYLDVVHDLAMDEGQD